MKRLTVKRFFILFVITLVLFGVWTFNSVTAQSNRLCVCHEEDKDTGEGHVIEVDDNSLKGHIKHGDTQCTVDCDTVIGNPCDTGNGGLCTINGQ